MNGTHRFKSFVFFETLNQGILSPLDAIYDCASLYNKNYKISGEYKLPKDEFLGTPELNVSLNLSFLASCNFSLKDFSIIARLFLQVYCDMENNGGGWTVIQRRKIGLTSFNRDWKQYKNGFGTIRGDFWLGNEQIFRLTRQPTVLRIEMEASMHQAQH